LRARVNRSARMLTFTGVGAAGMVVLIAVVFASYLLSLPFSLDAEEAAQRIRHYLKYQASQRYAELYRQERVDPQASQRYAEEISRIERLRFESVKVGRLFPDYVLSEQGPTFYVRAVIRDENDQKQMRYFKLGTGELVIGESSWFVWLFVF